MTAPSHLTVRDRASRWRSRDAVALLLGCLWLVSFVIPGRAAESPPSPNPWGLYIDAAAEAQSNGDLVAAEALLQSANDVAERIDGRHSLRASLTLMLLASAYADLKKFDTARVVPDIKIDLAEVDASYLPFTRLLQRFVAGYRKRWNELPANPTTENDRKRKVTLLESAARFSMVEIAFQKKILPPDDERIANALYDYALILKDQDKLSQAIEQLKQADIIWDQIASKRDVFALANEEAALFPPGLARQKADRMLEVKKRLALYYLLDGMALQDGGDDRSATERYADAERLLLNTLSQYNAFWPNHPTTGYVNFLLARVYTFWTDKKSMAEVPYRRALAIYEAANGADDNDVTFIAGDFAGYLRHVGRKDAALEIETRYGLNRPNDNH